MNGRMSRVGCIMKNRSGAYPNIVQMIFADWYSDGLPVARQANGGHNG